MTKEDLQKSIGGQEIPDAVFQRVNYIFEVLPHWWSVERFAEVFDNGDIGKMEFDLAKRVHDLEKEVSDLQSEKESRESDLICGVMNVVLDAAQTYSDNSLKDAAIIAAGMHEVVYYDVNHNYALNDEEREFICAMINEECMAHDGE